MLCLAFIGIVRKKVESQTVLEYCYLDLVTADLRTVGDELDGLAEVITKIQRNGHELEINLHKMNIPKEIFCKEDLIFYELSEMEKKKLRAVLINKK